MNYVIGTSLGKCIKDILDDVVPITSVMCIVTNTMIQDHDQLEEVVTSYYHHPMNPKYDMRKHELGDVVGLARSLYSAGIIHQPRLVHGLRQHHSLSQTWLEIAPDRTNDSPAAQKAYEHYQMLRNLTQ